MDLLGNVDAILANESTVGRLLALLVLGWTHLRSGDEEFGALDLNAGLVDAAQTRLNHSIQVRSVANKLDILNVTTK